MFKKFFLASFLALTFSCDETFNSVGVDIVNENHYNTETYTDAKIIAYNKSLEAVKTNSSPLYFLGNYNDPNFGTTQANIVSQVRLSTQNPTFGDNAEVTEVILNLPYYSTKTDIDNDGFSTYELDSVFPKESVNPMKIQIYESSYFMSDFNEEDFTKSKSYYSDENQTFEDYKTNLIYESLDFMPSNEEIVTYKLNEETNEEEVDEMLSPRFRVSLDNNQFFQEKIINAEGNSELVSTNSFKDYFRGLFIKTEMLTSEGSYVAIDLSNAFFEIKYKFDKIDEDDEDEDGDIADMIEDESSIMLTFTGNTVNTLTNNFNTTYQTALSSADELNGDELLYLKGGSGSMAIIELFDEEGLQNIKDENWLINEANLEFYVDKSQITNSELEPERLMVYDFDNKEFLIDYYTDTSVSSTPENSRIIHLEPLERDDNNSGYKYKIRLTDHLSNIISNDSTNVKLGLVVVNNVNEISNSLIKNDDENEIPFSTVTQPKGTILFGK